MVQLTTVSEADTCDALVETPCGDYELIDFGSGRKLERWGEIIVEYPDRLAIGEPATEHWSADWVYVAELGAGAHWEPTRSGLLREWTVNIGDQPLGRGLLRLVFCPDGFKQLLKFRRLV